MRRLFCLALLTLAAGCTASPKPEPVWIGHVCPLSGPGRDAGEESVRAVQAALEQAREDDFDVGGRRVGVRHVDSAPGARAEAVRLLAVNGVPALIVGPGAGEIEEIVAAARSHGAPVLVLDEVADPPEYAGALLLGPDPVARGVRLAEAARERVKGTKVAMIVDPSRPVCVRLAEAFARTWREGKGEVRSWDLKPTAPVVDAGEIQKWGFDLILLAVPASVLHNPPNPLPALLKGQTVLYGGEDGDELARGELLRGEAIAGLLGVTAFGGKDDLTEDGKKRFAALEKKHGSPPGRASALALDATKLLRGLMEQAKRPARDKLREALKETTELETVYGPMEWRSGRPRRPLFVVWRPAAKP